MPDKITYQDFSAKIKEKYPEYKDVDDFELASKMVEKYPEYGETVDLKKKDVAVPVQDVIPKAVSVSQSSKGGESVSASLDEAQTAQGDQPTYMQQQLRDKGLIVDEPKPTAPTTKKMGAVVDSGSETTKALKSSSARAASGIAGFQNFISDQLSGLIVSPIMKGLGYSDQEIEAVANVQKAAPILGLGSAMQSQMAQEQLNKYATDVESTMKKYDQGIIGSIQSGNYADAGAQIWKGAVQSLPYMAMTAATAGGGTAGVLATIGSTAAAQRYGELTEKESPEGSKLSQVGKFANSWAYGGFEAAGELATAGLLKTLKGAIGNVGKEVAEDVSKGFVKESLKAFGLEGSSEGATELGQQVTDYLQGVRDNIDLKAVGDAIIIGGVTGAGIGGTTGALNKAATVLAGRKIATDKQVETVNNNNAKIVDLVAEKEKASSPEVSSVIDDQIAETQKETNEIIEGNIEKASKLTPEELIKIKDIDDAIDGYDFRIDNPSPDDNIDLLKQIKDKLVSDKQAIVKEAVSKPQQKQEPVVVEAKQGSETMPNTEPKEPWQMTRREFAEFKGYNPDDLPTNNLTDKEKKLYPITRDVDLQHSKIIQQAMSKGNKVPQEVLNDYPELQGQKPVEAQNKPVEPLTAPEVAQVPPVSVEGLKQQKEPWQMTSGEFDAERPKVEGYLYHGSPEGDIKQIDPYAHTKNWVEGLGFYTTEDRNIAEGYAKGRTASKDRKTGKGRINYVKSKDVKTLDMDSPVDNKVWDGIKKELDIDFYEEPKTNGEAYRELIHAYNEDNFTSEGQYTIEEALSSLGYDATIHTEGKKSGTPHRVTIWKSEHNLPNIVSPKDIHKDLVREAILGGKKIPEEVLNEYPEFKKLYEKKQQKEVVVPKDVSDRLTEDSEGNFIFKHIAPTKQEVLSPAESIKKPSRLSSSDEVAAKASVGGVVDYYSEAGQEEMSGVEHTVKIPKNKVYDLQSDPLNFYDEAKKRFNEKYPDRAFNPNYQAAWIAKVAAENGFEMVVSKWGRGIIGKSVVNLKPQAKITEFKPKNMVPNVGDVVTVGGTEWNVESIVGDKINLKNENGSREIPLGRANNLIEDKRTPETKNKDLSEVYKERLINLKKTNPEKYWSVDVPSDEIIKKAAKEGKIVDVNGGMGIVTSDGNMIGMFKYDETKKGTAVDVQKERIALGGVKLDNFDGYLTDIYKKNGFRIVSRMDFNEEYAPKDMPASEKAKNPDVVFMVYDPKGEMDIKEQRFDKESYDQAKEYRDSYLEQQQQKQPIVGEQQIDNSQLNLKENGKENGQGRQGLQIEEAPIKGAAKRVADSLRKAKFIQSIDDLSKLSSDPTAILKVAWDGSVEVAAKAIEAGGSVAQAVADGINTLKASEWYKKLSDESKKIAETRFQSDIENHFKEQENAKGIRGQNKTDVIPQEGVVEGTQGKVSVGNDGKDQKTSRSEGQVKERQQGKKIIASETLPEDIKQQFEDEGINYTPRGKNIRRADAKEIALTKLNMDGGREQLKADIMDTTNEINGDTRVVLGRTFIEDSLLKSAQAETATERRKYRDEATEMLHFLMIRSTDIAQELQANKEISEMLAADPEMIEDVYRKEIAKKNAEFYSANKEPIKSAKQIIDDYLNSKEFKDKYKPKPDLSDNGKTSPRERRERGIAKIADAMSKIASLTGAKKNFVEEDFQRGSSLRDAISELASGILDVGVASTEELITKIKINTRKFLTSGEVDKIAKDVINETDAVNRITPKKIKKIKLEKEDEAKLVARLYGKMTNATEGQLRRLIADNIELFEREGSINDAAFKELFAKALGKDYVSDDVIDQLKKSAQIIFDVKVIEDDIKRLFDNALKLQKEGAAESAIKDIQKQIDARLKDHRLAVHEAEKANKYISESFSDPKTILTILGSNIQGNLVTTQSQLVNIIGNYSMMPIRAPKNFVAWMMDAVIANTIGNLKRPIMDAINKKQADYVSKEAKRLNIPESEVVVPTYFHKYKRYADKLADKELKRTGVGLSKYQFIGQARGFKEGVRQLWTGQLPSDIYKRDMMVALHPLNAMYDNYQMLTGKEKMEFKKFATNSVEALLSAPPEVMFRFLNLFDKPVRRGAELDKLNELANLKGLEGIEKKKFIEMPDEESAEEARVAGDKATFQQDTKLSKASSSLDVTLLKKAKESTNLMSKVGLYLAYFVKKGTVPFVKTPINVTMEMLDYALPHVSFAKGVFAMFAGDRKSFTENMGKAMIGAMINQGIGYLFATGVMSLASGGNEDEDKELISKKVKAAEYRDKPANYINTSALQRLINNQMYGTNLSLDWRPGDNISSYRRFGILSGIAMAHGEAYKGKTKEEIKEMTGIDMARLSFMPVVKSAAEQSFVTGTSALVNALIGSEYERDQYLVSLSKAAGATALPNSLRTYIQANDNYIRETKDKTLKGVDKFKSTLKADFKSSFTTDSGIPTKVTIWGEPVRRYEDGSSPAFQLFDITRSKVYRGDFGAKIFELYEKTKEEDIPEGLSRSDILPPVLGEKFNYEDKEVTLDPKTYEDYQIYVGTMLKKDVEAKVNSMEWDKMDNKEKILSLRKSWASTKKSARSQAIEFWKEQNIEKLNELLVKQQGVKIKKENMKKVVKKPTTSASDLLNKAR